MLTMRCSISTARESRSATSCAATPACVTHDFCYRHGFATYGLAREQCDAEFLQDMKQACGGFGGLGRLDAKEYGICQLAASQTYETVRRKGEPHFRTTGSTYCEYRPDP